MAEFPALPLFTDAYLADTRHLTTLQHGAFLLLLMTAWRSPNNCLPDDDEKLARWSGLDRRTWIQNKDTILSFWYKDDGYLRQKRLDDERKYVEHRRDLNSSAGKASALKRKDRHLTNVQPNTNQTSTPTPTPTPTPIAADKSAAGQQGKKNKKEEKIFTESEVNSATKGMPAYDPELIESEVLPGGWYDMAEKRGIRDERVYVSWKKFKDLTDYPYQKVRWASWIENEGGY